MKYRFLCALALLMLLNGCKQRTKPGTFSVLQGEKDGRPLFAVIDQSLRAEKSWAAFPWYLSVSTEFTNPSENGLPTDQEAPALDDWEDSLDKIVGEYCRYVYVGHITWNGSRQVLFYVDKPDSVVEALKKLADSRSSQSFNFMYERDEHWSKVSMYFEKSR